MSFVVGRNAPKALVRFPPGMFEKIKEMAEQGYRPVNSQIVMLLDEALNAEKAASNQVL